MEDLKPGTASSSPLTPLGFLERAATVYGDCTSIIYNNINFTWSQTHCRCLQLASSLCSLGIRRGDVVSVVAPNVPAMYELQFAVPFTGAVLNNINTRLDAPTISVILRHGEPKLVFVDCVSLALVLEAINLMPEIQRPTLVLITDDSVESASSEGFLDTYEGLVAKGNQNFQWIRPKSEWDPIVLNYTSGTTSAPKGVVHCHRGSFMSTINFLIDWAVPKQPVVLWSTLNMFHVNGWSFPWGIAAMGGTNICVRGFEKDIVFPLIKSHGVTHMCAAPTILNMILDSSTKEPLENPVQVLTGGSSPQAPVLRQIEALGFVVNQIYGLTETGGVIISSAWKRKWDSLQPKKKAEKKARQGVRTIGLAEIDVVDPASGESVKHDWSTRGEVVVRGSSVMLGYLKDPDANSECFKNGWFHTGDLGVIHPDGYLEIKDRRKDVIIVGGDNVSSVDVENVLYKHTAVKEAAVVPRPDDVLIETVCAFVVLKDGFEGNEPMKNEIVEFCKKRLPNFMVPKTVEFMKELPKTSMDKIDKTKLKNKAKEMGSLKKQGPNSKAKKTMMILQPERRNVSGFNTLTGKHGTMIQRRLHMNIKTFPNFGMAKPRVSNFSVHYVNSVSSIPCTWMALY